MSLAGTCDHCGRYVQVRSDRAAVFTCVRCGGTAELLDADTTRDTNVPLGAPQPLHKYVAMDGVIVKAQPNGDDAKCTSAKCGRTSRTCVHVIECVATLRAGAEQ